MVVCKFFLQGTCKFGNNCKFDHSLSDPYHYVNPNSIQVIRQPAASNLFTTKPSQPVSNVDTNMLVKSVVNEANAAEKGGQWLLTCYAPFKEKPAFPGLEDTSFEEVRYGFYEAKKNGSLDQYTRHIQDMLQTRIIQLKTLQNPSQEIVGILKNIYDTPASNSFGSSYSQIANVNRTGGFGGYNQQNSTFSSYAQPQQNTFVQNNPIFGASAGGQSIFGGQQTNVGFNNQSQSNASVFNSPVANKNIAPFGQQAPFGVQNTSIFGTQQPNNIFNSSQPVTTTSPFGNTPNSPFSGTSIHGQTGNSGSIFAPQGSNQAATGNIFAAASPIQQQPQQLSPPNQQQSIFGNTQQIAQPSIFSQSQPTTSPIGNPPQNPISGMSIAPNTQPNPFGGMGTAPPFAQPQISYSQIPISQSGNHTQSIFGGGFNSNVPVIEVDMSVYSKIEDLTADEINWFQSDTLDIATMPEKPPTYEMCHK